MSLVKGIKTIDSGMRDKKGKELRGQEGKAGEEEGSGKTEQGKRKEEGMARQSKERKG